MILASAMQTKKKKIENNIHKGLKGHLLKKFRINYIGATASRNSEGGFAQTIAELKAFWEAAAKEARLPYLRVCTTISRLSL